VDAETDWWDDLSEEARKSIQRGLDDIKKGKVTPHNDLMKKYKKWLS
jgi:predicted transcriptional regulator